MRTSALDGVLLEPRPDRPGEWPARVLRAACGLLTLATYAAWLVCLALLIHEPAHDLRWQVWHPSYLLRAVAYNDALMLLLPVCILAYVALDYRLAKAAALREHRAAPSLFARLFCHGAAVFLLLTALLLICDGLAAIPIYQSARGAYSLVMLAHLLPCLCLLLGMGAEGLEKRRPGLIWVKCGPPILCGIVSVCLLAGDLPLFTGRHGVQNLWDAVWPPLIAPGAGTIVTVWFLCGLVCCIVCFVMERRFTQGSAGSARLLCGLLWLAALGPVVTRVALYHILGMVIVDESDERMQTAALIGLVAGTIGLGLLRWGVHEWRRRRSGDAL